MEPITLPRFEWFCPNIEQPWTFNIYSASRGTDKDGGCIENPSFNYKVRIKVEEGQPPVIHAAYHIIPPWSKERDPKRVGESTFECTPEGLAATVEWLNAELDHLYD